MEPDETARRVRYWRERRGLSRRVCAELLGYSEGWLQKIEQGQRRLDRLPILEQLATVLRVPVAELLPPVAAVAEPVDPDLLELSQVAGARGVTTALLDDLEADIARLHRTYATLGPQDLLPAIVARLRPTTALLQSSQPAADRRRLLSAAANLAGLRGWLAFDLKQEQRSGLWYRCALRLAREADDASSRGWLLGALSLLPSYSGRADQALRLIGHGHRAAERGADAAVVAWLYGLDARERARRGDASGAEEALRSGHRAADRTLGSQHRHGMDFRDDHLDLSYYEGMSWLSLRRPQSAEPVLRRALDGLTPDRMKARSILLLTLAQAAVLDHQVDRACGLVREALELPPSQWIEPVLQRAREVRRALEPWSRSAQVRDLDQVLAE